MVLFTSIRIKIKPNIMRNSVDITEAQALLRYFSFYSKNTRC